MSRSIAILLFLIPSLGMGQLPSSYNQDMTRAVNLEYQRLKLEWDVVIPPLERLVLRPTSYNMAEGNWANAWTGASEFENEIITRANRMVIVYVLDTAPELTHPALSAAAWNSEGRSFTGEAELVDGQGHGHHVAGCIGAISSTTPLGVARALVLAGKLKIVPVEVLNDEGAGSYRWIEKGIRYATSHFQAQTGAFGIISMSLGGGSLDRGMESSMEEAKQAGMLIHAAAGNTGSPGIEYPGNSTYSRAIGSIDSNGKRSSFSSTGPELFMGAPGRSILSTWTGNQLATGSGTSMATPIQSALAAIVASVYPGLDAEGVQEVMSSQATDIDPTGVDFDTGYGYDHLRKLLILPDEPEMPELGTMRRHTIEVILPGPYTMMYQSGEGLFKEITLRDIHLKVKTKKYSSEAIPEVDLFVEEYFEGRAMTILHKEDALMAGYWAGRFLEIGSEKIKLIFVGAKVTDEYGSTGFPDSPPFWDKLRPSRRRSFRF